MDLGLKGKVMMVAASSKGLGFGIARQAALEGAVVSLGSRSKKNITEAANRIRKEVPGATVYASSLDVADPTSIEAWVKNTLKELGTIDGLVVNGGGPPPGTFDEIDDSTWLSGYENTLMSAVYTMEYAFVKAKMRQADITISPDIRNLNMLDFFHGKDVIAKGYETASKKLSTLANRLYLKSYRKAPA